MLAKGLDIPVEVLPYPLPEKFRELNPLFLVPVLEVNGEFLPESQVICEFLEDLDQGPSLRPESALDRARMRLLIRLFELHYDPAMLKLYPLMDPSLPKDTPDIGGALQQIKKALDIIATFLDGGKYAVGGRLSLADCALMPPFLQAKIFLPALQFDDLIACQQIVSDYCDATRRDPHVSAVLDDMEPYLRGIMGGGAE